MDMHTVEGHPNWCHSLHQVILAECTVILRTWLSILTSLFVNNDPRTFHADGIDVCIDKHLLLRDELKILRMLQAFAHYPLRNAHTSLRILRMIREMHQRNSHILKSKSHILLLWLCSEHTSFTNLKLNSHIGSDLLPDTLLTQNNKHCGNKKGINTNIFKLNIFKEKSTSTNLGIEECGRCRFGERRAFGHPQAEGLI